jgi:hypothetical protein
MHVSDSVALIRHARVGGESCSKIYAMTFRTEEKKKEKGPQYSAVLVR